MAATGHRRWLKWVLALLFACIAPLYADRAADVLNTVNYVATALSDSDAPDAMKPFEKSLPDYGKLRDYFDGLASRGPIENEVNVTDEQDSEAETNLTVEWTMTITTRGFTGDTERRVETVKLRLVPDDGKWKIAGLSPISFFDPRPRSKSSSK